MISNNKLIKMNYILIFLLFGYSSIFSNTNDEAIYTTFNSITHDSTSNIILKEIKIGDEENLQYAFLYTDNFLIILTKMDATKGILDPLNNYMFFEKSGNRIDPNYMSPELNSEITKNIAVGIQIYELEDIISPGNWNEDKYKLAIKNKKGKVIKANIDLELLNTDFKGVESISSDSKYKKQYLEAKILLTIKEIEKSNSIDNFTKDSLNDLIEEINLVSDLNYTYLYYYLNSLISENINSSILYLDSSFSKGNNDAAFINNYFNRSMEYADTLFENKNFEELKNRSDSSLVKFKDILTSEQNEKSKFEFYKTYSQYYLIQTDQEIKDDSKNLINIFRDLIKEFKNENNKELECYSRLALGNIYFVIGNTDSAMEEYISLKKDDAAPMDVKEKAANNLEKAKKE